MRRWQVTMLALMAMLCGARAEDYPTHADG
jgi:hypothetical protein